MKTEKHESVVHDWVMDLPFTQQAVLFCAIRGADGVSKYNRSKYITQFIRGVVLKTTYDGFSAEDDYQPDGFMRCDFQHFNRDAQSFFDDVDSLPHHFFMHLVHAAEIIGYSYPDAEIAKHFEQFYRFACHSFHMQIETMGQLFKRLSA